jgi:hypothetical protein
MQVSPAVPRKIESNAARSADPVERAWAALTVISEELARLGVLPSQWQRVDPRSRTEHLAVPQPPAELLARSHELWSRATLLRQRADRLVTATLNLYKRLGTPAPSSAGEEPAERRDPPSALAVGPIEKPSGPAGAGGDGPAGFV